MTSLSDAIPIDNQPIGGPGGATLLHEERWLTEWVTPQNLEVQSEYERLTQGLTSSWDKIMACFNRVLDIPYTEAVKVRVSVDGWTYVQKDAWLDPGQALHAPSLNCANRAFLLASLLRQEFPPDKVWVVLGNLNVDGQGGHAWCLLRNSEDYILETTSPNIRKPIRYSQAHEGIIYFNDQQVRAVPGLQIREPFTKCWCHKFLQDYLAQQMCWEVGVL
jgi:hypothetical protein